MTLCWVFKACFSKKTEKNISSANLALAVFFFGFFGCVASSGPVLVYNLADDER